MIKYWNEHELDMLLLLQDTDKAYGYTGSGDFHLDELGTVTRALTTEPFPYMFAGVHLVKPEAIVENSKNVSSFREYYPGIGDLYSKVRLAGIPMQGHWYHANTPQDIVEIERAFKNGGLEKT